MTVKNMTNTNGRKVPNQFVISDGNKTTFQSYESPIITIDGDNKVIEIGEDWNYSRTTGRYRNKFMEDEGFAELASTKGLEKAIKDGKIDDFIVKMV